MNIQNGDKVNIRNNTKGIIEEITDNDILVKQQVMIDGSIKNIKQWYDKGMIIEVTETVEQETHDEAISIVDELKRKGLDDEQISDLTKDKENFKKRIIELGIVPKEDDIDE